MLTLAATALRQEENAGRAVPTREAMNRGMERNEDMLRLNPESGLGQLATETGGFLVRDTNDARAGFGRIAEDMRFHYVLSYAPTNDKMDGTLPHDRGEGCAARACASRRGRATWRRAPRSTSCPCASYEAPALAQLDRKPRPDAFPLACGRLSFPEADAAAAWRPCWSRSRAAPWSLVPRGPAGCRADFAVLVRIRDARGREADRLSQDYRLTAPADKLEAARRGRRPLLPRGRPARRATTRPRQLPTTRWPRARACARSSSRSRPRSRTRLRLSSLMLVSRAEKLTPEEQQDTARTRCTSGRPSCTRTWARRSTSRRCPRSGSSSRSTARTWPRAQSATIEVRAGEQVLARTSSELPPPDAKGRIQHAGALPLKALAPGDYRLKVSVSDGRTVESRHASFTVVE